MTVLQKENIVLRPLQEQDKQAIASLLNNKKICDNLRDFIPYPYSEQNAQEFIAFTQSENPTMTFAILAESNFCGVIGLVGEKDIHRKNAEIGYWLGEPFWGKGITSIAVGLITNYALHQLDFARVHTGIFEYNLASMRVLEKNGYQREGIFKKALFKNNQFWDEHRYAFVKSGI